MESFQLRRLLFVLTGVLNLVLWIVLAPIILVPVAILAVYRYVINFLAKKLHPEYITCTKNDVLFVRETPDVMKVTNGAIVVRVEGSIDYESFLQIFNETFITTDIDGNYDNLFCDIVSFGGYLFKRKLPDLRIRDHFCKRLLGENEKYQQVLSSWMQTPFPAGKPLWNVMVLMDPGISSNHADNDEDITYIALKANHILLDGYSLVNIIDKLTGCKSYHSLSITSAISDYQNFSLKPFNVKCRRILEEASNIYSLPFVSLKYVMRDFWYRDAIPTTATLEKVEMMPMALGTCDIEPIKEVRRQLNVKFPAIVYSLQIGALRKLLLKAKNMKEDELTDYTFLTTSLPIPNHPRNGMTNHWSGGKIRIPLKSPSAKYRVLSTNRYLQRVLNDNAPFIAWKYLSFFVWVLPTKFSYWLSYSNLGQFRYRACMSCIPQSIKQYFLMGKRITNVYHAPMVKDSVPQAVMLGCSSSYENQVDFTLFAHPEFAPSQSSMDLVMHEHFRDEVQELLAECNIKFPINWRSG